MPVGTAFGMLLGTPDGPAFGRPDGIFDGKFVGIPLGTDDGIDGNVLPLGDADGTTLGPFGGIDDGTSLGTDLRGLIPPFPPRSTGPVTLVRSKAALRTPVGKPTS